MTDTVLVVACDAANVAADGTCTVPVWVVYEPSPFPALTLEEGAVIGASIVACWAVGLGFRHLIKSVR